MVALADPVGGHQLGVGIQGHEGPLIADPVLIVVGRHLALLLLHVGPDLIDLEPLARQLAHLLIHEGRTARPHLDKEAHHGIAVNARHALRGTDGVAFHETSDSDGAAVERKAVHRDCLEADVYDYIYKAPAVNGNIDMDFKAATDEICERVDHEDVARALGISLQAVRQARMSAEAKSHRHPPAQWTNSLIRIAEERVWHYRELIERLRSETDAA